jgi:hypothetical protein
MVTVSQEVAGCGFVYSSLTSPHSLFILLKTELSNHLPGFPCQGSMSWVLFFLARVLNLHLLLPWGQPLEIKAP